MTTTYGVTLDVTLDHALDDDQAATVARAWSDELRFTYAGHTVDGARVQLDALCPDYHGAEHLAATAADTLRALLTEHPYRARVRHWHAVQVLDGDELRARATRPALPPLVDAQQLADLCGVSRTRVYQWDRDRPDGFPAPVVPGYWLAAEARQWARVRPTRPGPRPTRTEQGTTATYAAMTADERAAHDTTGETP